MYPIYNEAVSNFFNNHCILSVIGVFHQFPTGWFLWQGMEEEEADWVIGRVKCPGNNCREVLEKSHML
jgi:hypothetical protein